MSVKVGINISEVQKFCNIIQSISVDKEKYMLPLEIYLITYNRKDYLQRTLTQILADHSPVKSFPITVLDNASTDGSSELIEKFVAQHPNLTHIRHEKNIGGNANICKALGLARQKYVWVLADDDTYDWSAWSEVEQAIEKETDFILVSKTFSVPRPLTDFEVLNEMSFLPGAIFKTEYITDEVLQVAYNNISNSFPHLALACYLFNEHKTYQVTSQNIVHQGWELKTNSQVHMTRGIKRFVHYRFKTPSLFTCLINSFQLLDDRKLRYQCCGHIFTGHSFFWAMIYFFVENKFSVYNCSDIFWGISLWQKIIFMLTFGFYLVGILPLKILLGSRFDRFIHALRTAKRRREGKI